jgi:arsenate reductase (thioredoxin)
MRTIFFPHTSKSVDTPPLLASLLLGSLLGSLLVGGCDSASQGADKAASKPAIEASPAAAQPEAEPNPPASSAGAEPRELPASAVELHPKLASYVEGIVGKLDAIPAERRKQLDKLALYIKTKQSSGETAKLVFICTHNSRRSHISQLWASVAAAYFGISGVESYSGGTEATAFNPRAVAALERAGFAIRAGEEGGENPRYAVDYAPEGPQLEAFSKKYSDPPNPKDGFAAIMTCSEADKNCPMVEGASLRVPIPYVDPKEADDSPEETAAYDERTEQIAIEMFYLFAQVVA